MVNPNINFSIACQGSYQLSFVDTSDKDKPYNKTKNDYMNVRADFWLNSDNCTIALQSSVFSANSGRESKALYYSLMVTLMCLAHLFATVQVIKNIAQNEHDGGRYSLISLCFLTIWDVFMCLFHLYNALTTEVRLLNVKNLSNPNRISSIISLRLLSGSLSSHQFSKQDSY